MAQTEVTSLILRFRDLVTVSGDTIRIHHEIISREGHVWWGWWRKMGEEVPVALFTELKRVATSGGLVLLLYDSGNNRIYRVNCIDLRWETGEPVASPDPKRTPPYYVDQKYCVWFKLDRIDKDPIAEDKLRELTYVRVDEFFSEGRSRYDMFYGKRIHSGNELRQQDRTMWFTRPRTHTDPDHEISLLDARKLRPSHFPKDYIQTRSLNLLWLSDLHFSDDHHRFPFEPSPDAKPIGLRLELALQDHRIGDIGGVVVSGDITWRAEEKEFQRARESLKSILSWANLQPYQIGVSPGNHDLRFSEDPARKDAPVEIVGKDSRKQYEDFYRDLFYLTPNDYLSSGRRFLLGGAVPVDIVCLNSSWLEQHEGKFQGHGFVGEDQLRDASTQMGWEKSNDTQRAYRIVMLHHHVLPTTYREDPVVGAMYSVVLDAEALSRWVVEHRVQLVIHGHMHQPICSKVSKPLKPLRFEEWHAYYVVGMGSSGVGKDHLGEIGHNTFGVITFARSTPELRVFSLDPKNPSEQLFSVQVK